MAVSGFKKTSPQEFPPNLFFWFLSEKIKKKRRSCRKGSDCTPACLQLPARSSLWRRELPVPKASCSSSTPFFHKKVTFSLKMCSALIARSLWSSFLITKLIASQCSRLFPQQISSDVLNKAMVWVHFSTVTAPFLCHLELSVLSCRQESSESPHFTPFRQQ